MTRRVKKPFKKGLSANLAWALVLCGGVIECFWVSGLKYADNFLLYTLTALGIATSFCLMIIACKKIEVSVAYAVFVGLGTAGVVLSELFIFDEPFSLAKIALIVLLLASVIALKFASKEQDKELVSELSENLGLDELENELASLEGGRK